MMRPDISSGDRPPKLKATPITGMPMSGKMSVGVLKRRQRPEDQDQQRHDDEGEGPLQRDADDPGHGLGYS